MGSHEQLRELLLELYIGRSCRRTSACPSHARAWGRPGVQGRRAFESCRPTRSSRSPIAGCIKTTCRTSQCKMTKISQDLELLVGTPVPRARPGGSRGSVLAGACSEEEAPHTPAALSPLEQIPPKCLHRRAPAGKAWILRGFAGGWRFVHAAHEKVPCRTFGAAIWPISRG